MSGSATASEDRTAAAWRAIRAAEARLRAAQAAGHIGAFEARADSRQLIVTDIACRIFGLPVAETYDAKVFRDLVLPQDREIATSVQTLADGSAPLKVEYRIRRADDGALRWISRRGAFEFDEAGRAVSMSGIVEDITERKLTEARTHALLNLGDALREAETPADAIEAGSRLLGETLEATRTGYAMVDATAELFLLRGGWAQPGDRPMTGDFPFSVFPRTAERLAEGAAVAVSDTSRDEGAADDAAALKANGIAALIAAPMKTKGQLDGVMFVHSATARAWDLEEIEFARVVADRIHSAVTRLRAEADQAILNQELSHRLKNTLAVVQSIAQMTLAETTDRAVLRQFNQRLTALARAHEMLAGQSWVAARMRAVVESGLELHGAQTRTSVNGPELKLNARAALTLSLILHELATNAAKYGALSQLGGCIDLFWSVEGGGPDAALVLDWRETGGPLVVAPTRRGFGSKLLGLGFDPRGTSRIDYPSDGLTARFTAPLALLIEP